MINIAPEINNHLRSINQFRSEGGQKEVRKRLERGQKGVRKVQRIAIILLAAATFATGVNTSPHFEIFGSVKKRLLVTVLLDHPVVG